MLIKPTKTLPSDLHDKVLAAYPDPLEAEEMTKLIRDHYAWLKRHRFYAQIDKYVSITLDGLEQEADKKNHVIKRRVTTIASGGKVVLVHATAIIFSAVLLWHFGLHQ